LGPSGLDQAVFDVFIGADPIKGGQALVGERSPVAQKRSVNALPLSVRTLLMMKEALSIRRLRKPPAEVADLILTHVQLIGQLRDGLG